MSADTTSPQCEEYLEDSRGYIEDNMRYHVSSAIDIIKGIYDFNTFARVQA
jgi:hypothetical protein